MNWDPRPESNRTKPVHNPDGVNGRLDSGSVRIEGKLRRELWGQHVEALMQHANAYSTRGYESKVNSQVGKNGRDSARLEASHPDAGKPDRIVKSVSGACYA